MDTITTSCVSFPASAPAVKQSQPAQHLRGPHLPFRRISLPTAPSLLHRQSVASVASFDSLPEDGQSSPHRLPSLMRNTRGKERPTSIESPRRRQRRRDESAKPSDEARAVKRRKIVNEFYETEKAYVDGLELIYSHFLTPIIASLDTPEPLLNRSTLTSIFSNFIDIWNLHRSFFSALTTVMENLKASDTNNHDIPPLSPILLSHFPYLSLYNPFVTAFPSMISSLMDLISPPTLNRPHSQYSPTFAAFLQEQEADPRCGKLKLRDWLLTIVQRCPRYLLLLKDLINSTNRDDPEHAQLTAAHSLVSKITLSLNTSLHTHAQTLALLALQRSTPNLPFQLITPGRTLLKRGPLLQAERSSQPQEREFLLFSDCLIWLSGVDVSGHSWDWDWSKGAWSGSGNGSASSTSNEVPRSATVERPPPLVRSRSKSEAELPKSVVSSSSDHSENTSPSTPVSPNKPYQRKSYYAATPLPPPLVMAKRRTNSSSIDERWVYKGHVEIVDLEVIVSSVPGEERRFEVLSPEGSFALYAASEEDREGWVSAIRQAKAQLLISLNVTNPNSTLTSSASTNHVRRSLQALPFPPTDERLATLRANPNKSAKGKSRKKKVSYERRRKVEHWVPPIWIPDGKTDECMRCGKMFGWRRRRHHCRLCGRCVCAACSGRTFFISDSNSKDDSTKPARACDACYETVFPVFDAPPPLAESPWSATGKDHTNDTITSLSHFPSWLSMLSAPGKQPQPQALMTIDTNYGADSSLEADLSYSVEDREDWDRGRKGVLRLKPHQRLRSYHQILEDFEEHGQILEHQPGFPRGPDNAEGDNEGENRDEYADLWITPTHSVASSPVSSPRKRREDTARRSKRFSLPAVALQTTPVTARTSVVIDEDGGDVSRDEGTPNRPRRFSLLLSGKNARSQPEIVNQEDVGLAKGVAANRLSELLGRKSKD